MRSLYLGYSKQYDPETSTWCISGVDATGSLFGVGAGRTEAECEQRLRDYVLDVLDSHANAGEDHFGDLVTKPPRGSYIEFNPVDLFPSRLKLARARAGLRQADMAARLGITQQGYAKLERMGANPTLRTVLQAERVLGLDLLSLNIVSPPKRKKRSLRSATA
jgi:DNA-binding XRE family transcriptional regulator